VWDNALQLVGLVVLLIVILIATYYTTKFVGGIKLGQLKNSNFIVIDTYHISQNKALQIVKVANKYIVIAIGKDTINFITELDESEVLIRDMNNKDKLQFKQILEKLKINKE
jgi:flagellar protein FliO/FliZ